MEACSQADSGLSLVDRPRLGVHKPRGERESWVARWIRLCGEHSPPLPASQARTRLSFLGLSLCVLLAAVT